MSLSLEELQQRLLDSPAARARFLSDTLDLLEKNGIDVSSAEIQQKLGPSLDLSDGAKFLSALAASSMVVAIGQGAQPAPEAAGAVVIVAATAGQRRVAAEASTVVVVAASAGQRALAAAPGGAGAPALTITVPVSATLADVAAALHALGDLLADEASELSTQVQTLVSPGSNGPTSPPT
jgi:hypothetical protein